MFLSYHVFPGQNYPDNRGTEFIVGYMANYKLENSPELFVTTSKSSVVTVSVTAPMFPDAGMILHNHTRLTMYYIRPLLYDSFIVSLLFSHGVSKTCIGYNTKCIGTVKLSNPMGTHTHHIVTNTFHRETVCLFVLEFYGPVNNEVMWSRSVNCRTVTGQA